MPDVKLRYACGVCGRSFEERWEASACQSSHDVEEVEIFICACCGEEFDEEEDALLHEETCDIPSCHSCRHCGENRRRWHPCPRPSFDRNMDGCNLYERDRDTHVAHA